MKLLFCFVLLASTHATVVCNPLKQRCDSNDALGASIKETFSSETKYFAERVSNGVSYSSDGVRFRVSEKGDNPSIMSNFYMMFGKVEAVIKGAPGRGIVSSFYLQSDDLDEIDIEILGANTKQWQSNFFSKGNTTTYDRGEFHDAPTSLVDEYHIYTIEFSQDKVTFALDGKIMRTLDSTNPQGFPQTPMRIFAGNWAGGDPSNPPGTIEWAGGLTDYPLGPFDMDIKSIIAVDYSSGSQYKYNDQSGSWTSIESVGGEVNGRLVQAKKEFEKIKNGCVVSDSSSESCDLVSSTSLNATGETSSKLGSSKDFPNEGTISTTSKTANLSTLLNENTRPSTTSSFTSGSFTASFSKISSARASSRNFGFFILLFTIFGYLI